MKNIYFLIGCCLAMMLAGGGERAWGQWANVWYVPSTDYFTGSCTPGTPSWTYYNNGHCDGLNITGSASYTWTRWHSNSVSGGSDYAYPNVDDCSNVTEWNNGNSYRYYYVYSTPSVLDGSVTYTRYKQKCQQTGTSPFYGYGWENGGSYDSEGTASNVGTTNISDIYGSHLPHPDIMIINPVSGTYTHFNWGVPVWNHYYYMYYVEVTASGIFVRESNETTSSDNGTVTNSTITTTGSVRLTGTPQFQKSNTTAILNNNATGFFFDQSWDGWFGDGNPTANVDEVSVTGWDMRTDGVTTGKTLGFYSGYNNSSNRIQVEGGTLALGGSGSESTQHLDITTATYPVTVDAYTALAPGGCVTLANAVDYNNNSNMITTLIEANQFRITNTNWGCAPVNFHGLFSPTFSGNGSLLINPNVTNFKAGANINNTYTGATDIESKKITVTGNFYYESKEAPFKIFFTHQSQDCAGCGYLNVSGNFETKNNGTSGDTITDYPGGDRSYVQIDGNYTHTSTVTEDSIGSHTVNVSGRIDIGRTAGGSTTLTAVNDTVSFTSRDSWIKFTDPFTFTGTNGGVGTGVLKIEASDTDDPCTDLDCEELTGSYVWFHGAVNTENETNGKVTILSANHYVQMDAGFTHKGVDGTLRVNGYAGVYISPGDVSITRTGKGNDQFLTDKGYIYINGELTYNQSNPAGSSSLGGLSVTASGDPCTKPYDCVDAGNYVWITGAVNTTNVSNGTVEIQSPQHYVRMDNGFTHTGVNAQLLVSGNTRVDLLGDAVTITRTGSGGDNIKSTSGHIYVEKDFFYTNQPSGSGSLVMIAEGMCNAEECAYPDAISVGGYVLFDSPVSIEALNSGSTSIWSDHDTVSFKSGITYSGENGKLWIKGFRSVNVYGSHPANPGLAGGGPEGVYIYRNGIGEDEIHSDSGHIHVTSPFTYWQKDGTNNGLMLSAEGNCNAVACGAPVGGYVMIDSTVITKNNATNGYVTIKSANHHVTLGHGMIHEGNDGELNIIGETSVNILHQYHNGTTVPGGSIITDVPSELDSIGLFIHRLGAANDNILSPSGHIHIQQPFTYDQAAGGAKGLTLLASGDCLQTDCDGTVGGYVRIDSAVTTTNLSSEGFTAIQSAKHYVLFDRGFVHYGINGNMLLSGHTSVDINKAYPSTAPHSILNSATSTALSASEGVYINRAGTGNDTIQSPAGHVSITDPFTYIQKESASGGSGLTVLASGDLCIPECGLYTGGYVYIGGAVSTTNVGAGHTNIISDNHYVNLANGYTHIGKGGNLYVKGETRVDILGDSLFIQRDSTGSDGIFAPSGHIFVEKNFRYDQSGANDMGVGDLGSLLVIASGACDAFEDCGEDTIVNGFVWFHDSVNIANYDNGLTKIKSNQHYVKIDGALTYTGEATSGTYQGVTDTLANTTLLVYGHRGIDVLGAASITMDSVGQVTFLSDSGHIHFGDAFDFTQTDMYSNNATHNGISLIARGIDSTLDCIGRPGHGYIWMEGPVTTTTLEHGRAEFVSENHNVIMDSTLTHHGVEGNLDVIAGGTTDTSCHTAEVILPALPLLSPTPSYTEWFNRNVLYEYPAETPLSPIPPYLTKYQEGESEAATESFAHAGRGYIHIGDTVAVTLDSIGNATFQSKADIIQFDKTFDFTGVQGGDLYVDGYRGIRSTGNVTTTNAAYVLNDAATGSLIPYNDYQSHPGNFNTVDVTWRTPVDTNAFQPNGSGNVRYNSAAGYVDFLGAFTHTAVEDSSRLDIEGYTRVKFAGDVNIAMSLLNDMTPGETFIYSDNGYIDFRSALTYASRDADFRLWAKGAAQGDPSCIDSLACDAQDGHILFRGPVTIDYTAQTALSPEGRTWIKSFHDDVVIDSTSFLYQNTTGSSNGMFWMQAGQDILGRLKGKDIEFIHAGEKSIVWEAQGSIRTQQDLIFDRTDAKSGNIILKAGYEYTERTGDSSVYDIDVNGKTNPVGNLNWTRGLGTSCPPEDYVRLSCDEGAPRDSAGNIWFQGKTAFDLSGTQPMAASDSAISVLLRALNSVYIDSTFTYIQNQQDSVVTGLLNDKAGYFRLFAENGNIEAINAPNTSVDITVTQPDNSSEIRFQAGNDPRTPDICTFADFACYNKAQWDGNILFNKPLNITSAGLGYTLLSAERDLETQVDAPFTFTYSSADIKEPLLLTAGRHIETHRKMSFNYDQTTAGNTDVPQITLQAGRLNDEEDKGCSLLLCKTVEEGTNLADGTNPYTPSDYTNGFAIGGKGHGSILAFDSLEFNYNGQGTILLTALNGNIENDPYLHRGAGVGYDSEDNIHEAQITFNHGGSGKTRLEAIDIKLHDKLAYHATQPAGNLNGQFYMAAFDSILTRNLKYTNPTDSGSVFITAAKYKDVSPNDDCGEYKCEEGGPGIHQGHIVLGYGADHDEWNLLDSIVFDFAGNANTEGANVHILAGFEGFEKNKITGKSANATLFADDIYGLDKGKGKAYGGNITFDYMEFYMAQGNARQSGFTEIRTPNGNIWGKDSIVYSANDGDLLIDAGLGSADDRRAILWSGFDCNTENILNTNVPFLCDDTALWRTGNIMMKGAHLDFNGGSGDAVIRTREGFIDLYDAFTLDGMSGDLLVYAGTDSRTEGLRNAFGDASTRDFAFNPVSTNGSIFFGADDNIMLNYGNSNTWYKKADNSIIYGQGGKGFPGKYDETAVNTIFENGYYHTSYEGYINNLYAATYDVNKDGYLFYKNGGYVSNPGKRYHNGMHQLYRGGSTTVAGCVLKENGARDLTVNFENALSGGFAAVASNYIDLFTKFTYLGGAGTALGQVPGMSGLHGENVTGYGLYLKSQFNGESYNTPENRRVTCESCGETSTYPIQGSTGKKIPEMTYIGFHDEARIHTHSQKSHLEAPVIEFFGHAEADAYRQSGSNTKITLKGDSLIYHDSVIFDGMFRSRIDLVPFTADADLRNNEMRYGVINDRGPSLDNYKDIYRDVQEREKMGPAIEMPDRGLPVIELGYQRCTEPGITAYEAPNSRSVTGLETTPEVGGDVILAFKHGFKLPIFNSIVANNARISFLTDMYDGVSGGEYVNAFIRTDLLRIRNRVEFYTDPVSPEKRSGNFVLSTPAQMDDIMDGPGIYMRHLHTEPGSELSLPGENSLTVIPTTVMGGYGNIHENIFVKDGGIIAPGYASLMESDCQTPNRQGRLTVHNLDMEQYSILRISIGSRHNAPNRTQTDTLIVQDSIFFKGKIILVVMPEDEYIEPGCYHFLEYGDSLGLSAEYVNHLILARDRYKDLFFSLDFSTPGKVNLCVSGFPDPPVQRYVDLPAIEGVTYNYVKVNGAPAVVVVGRNYVGGHQDFEMNLTWTGAPLKTWAYGFYSHADVDLDATSVQESNGSVTYIIRQVVEPWSISFGPGTSTAPWVGNDNIGGQSVWTHKNVLYINAPSEDIVSIYSITGILNKKVEIPSGLSKLPLNRGMYVVTLKNGTVYKIVIR